MTQCPCFGVFPVSLGVCVDVCHDPTTAKGPNAHPSTPAERLTWTHAGRHRRPNDRHSPPVNPCKVGQQWASGLSNCLRVLGAGYPTANMRPPNRQKRSTEPKKVRQKWRGNSRWVNSMTQRPRFFSLRSPR